MESKLRGESRWSESDSRIVVQDVNRGEITTDIREVPLIYADGIGGVSLSVGLGEQ